MACLSGLAASYAAGVVRCDLRRGVAELVVSKVERGLFTASPSATDIAGADIRYRMHRVDTTDPAKLGKAVQGPLTELEVDVSVQSDTPRWTIRPAILDGPLRKRRQLPRTIGYIKTQQGKYLPAQLSTVVTSLRPGKRSPVFRVGTAWALLVVCTARGRQGRLAGIARVDAPPT